jgi:hypothetical protein
MTDPTTDPANPQEPAPDGDELTDEEVAAVRASQADPGTPPADDPEAG